MAARNMALEMFFLALLHLSLVAGQNNSIGCFVPLQCVDSAAVGVTMSESPLECLSFCQEVESCNYFTHYADEGYCLGFTECVDTDDDCDDCISGTGI